MDHSWRPCPIQGNICPTCSISHFPFCPPHPHPYAYPGSNFDPIRGPINMVRPIHHNSGDPYYDPGYWNRNPSLPHVGDFGTVNRGPNSMQNPGFGDMGYMGSDYNVNDRSSKRLRVDGMYPGPYGGEGDANLSSNLSIGDNERRLKLIHDHGGVNPVFGFDGDVRGYAQKSPGFDRDVDGREPGNAGNMGMTNSPRMGYGVHYQREELEYQSGYGSHHSMKRSVSNIEHDSLGNKFQNHDHELAKYGQVTKAYDPATFRHGGVGRDNNRQSHGNYDSNCGSYHVPNESYYGGSFEPMHSNNAPMDYNQRSNMPVSNHYSSIHPPFPSAMQEPGQMRYDYHSPSHFDVRQPIETRPRPVEGYQGPVGNQTVPTHPHYGFPQTDYRGGYGNSVSENMTHLRGSLGFEVGPPIPASPPPPLPMEPPVHWPTEHKRSSSPPRVSPSLFPVPVSSSAAVYSSHAPVSESHQRANPNLQNSQLGHATRSGMHRDSQGTLSSFGQYLGDGHPFPSKISFPDKPKTIDAAHLFKPPHRTSRPDHFVIILRGLPGSGKSYLAKMLRDLEVEHGGSAPRIHSMDDYFMTEVEKTEENEASRSSVRGKKTTTKVLEYCYEPEMEEAYRSSMLKAFKKTLEEGAFTFVIVDDRNLRVADFAQFWATAKRAGYEVYVLEAPYKDPAGCTARNVHSFTQVDVEKMAAQWEEAPSLYLQLDVKSLFHGDDLKESNIEEVDMEAEDGDIDGGLSKLEEREAEKNVASLAGDLGPYVLQKDERNWDAEAGNPTEVKDLGRSKWSGNLDDDDDERTEDLKGKTNVLSGLLRTYGKEGKSVHWGDQV